MDLGKQRCKRTCCGRDVSRGRAIEGGLRKEGVLKMVCLSSIQDGVTRRRRKKS